MTLLWQSCGQRGGWGTLGPNRSTSIRRNTASSSPLPPAARNGMGSSTTGTAHCPFMLRSIPRRVRCSAAPGRVIRAMSLSRSSRPSSNRSRADAKSTSSSTISAHKTQKVRTFLVAHPNVRLHYTPTYSSWLNQVELWFSKIERDVTACGVYASVTDLRRKLMRYIKQYNKTAKPVRWATPIRRGASHDRCTGRSDGLLSKCHRHALREWLRALKRG